MSTAKFHALAAAASAVLHKEAPKGARAWSRALPCLEVCLFVCCRPPIAINDCLLSFPRFTVYELVLATDKAPRVRHHNKLTHEDSLPSRTMSSLESNGSVIFGCAPCLSHCRKRFASRRHLPHRIYEGWCRISIVHVRRKARTKSSC